MKILVKDPPRGVVEAKTPATKTPISIGASTRATFLFKADKATKGYLPYISGEDIHCKPLLKNWRDDW